MNNVIRMYTMLCVKSVDGIGSDLPARSAPVHI